MARARVCRGALQGRRRSSHGKHLLLSGPRPSSAAEGIAAAKATAEPDALAAGARVRRQPLTPQPRGEHGACLAWSVGRHQVPSALQGRKGQAALVHGDAAGERAAGRAPVAARLGNGGAGNPRHPLLGPHRRHGGVAQSVVDEDPDPRGEKRAVGWLRVSLGNVVEGRVAVPLLPTPGLRLVVAWDRVQGALDLRIRQICIESLPSAAAVASAVAPVSCATRAARAAQMVEVVFASLLEEPLHGRPALGRQLLRPQPDGELARAGGANVRQRALADAR
mmetsp:Transcript_88480/g.263908  ORF Transcript_88480/g.263908 Transcript_88480/m.263908 type:complete len:279 (-) Transcript_88480:862-1698(-)